MWSSRRATPVFVGRRRQIEKIHATLWETENLIDRLSEAERAGRQMLNDLTTSGTTSETDFGGSSSSGSGGSNYRTSSRVFDTSDYLVQRHAKATGRPAHARRDDPTADPGEH